MKKIIVTGGAGFIGTHLADRLIKEGFSVIVIDNLLTGTLKNLNPKAKFIKGDISKQRDIKRLPSNDIQAVFHLAAQSSGEISFEDPYTDFKVNVGGTLLLLEWCKRNNIKRFIYSSSMAVYGKTSDKTLTEDTPCDPISFYGIAKFSSEKYIGIYSNLGIKATILRLFNVYGSKQNLRNLKQGMASIYLSFLLKGEPILVKGSLDRFRDQIHVSDVVESMILCLRRRISIGKTYNIATGKKTTVRELINTLIKVSGNSKDYSVIVKDGTRGDIFGCYANISKAKEELSWSYKYDLELGLREMYNYFQGI